MAPKKRKHESCSPDAKDTSRPSDWMPVVEQFLDILGSIRDELRGIAQAQVKSTVEVPADKFPKLDENVENILNKIKEDLKEEIKEVVKFEMQGNMGKSDGVQLDNKQNQSKVVCDDYAKAPDCSDVSPSLRSQPHQSQTPRFRLQINSTMSSVSYKGRDVQTNDGSGDIEVEMRDGDNPIAHDHPLASVKVKLVLVDAELFHGISKKVWSLDDFRETLWNPENTKLLKNDTFRLNGGRAIQPKVIITQGTVRKEIRLGVMVEELASERVLEGLSNPFKVQEAKTAKTATNGTVKVSIPLGQTPCQNDQQYLPRQILSQPIQHDCREREGSATHHTTKDLPRQTGESLQQPQCKIEDPPQERLPHIYDARSSHPQVIIQSSSHVANTPTEGNGHGRISGQQYYQQTTTTQRFAVPNRPQIVQYVAGNDPISRPQQQYTNPWATTQQYHSGSGRGGQVSGPSGQHYQQGQGISSQYLNLLPSSLPAINSQIVGNGRGGPFVLRRSEQQIDTTYQQGNNDNFQLGQRQFLPQPTSTEAVKHAGQGKLNSHQHHSVQQKSLFPAMHAQTMDLDIRLNSSQNMPYSSTSQINAPQKDSLSLPHTQIEGNASQGQLSSHRHHSLQQQSLFLATHAQAMGHAENSQQQFQHGQSQIVPETRKDEVITGGQGQVVFSQHNVLPPSSLQAVNGQSVAGQSQLNSQNLLATMPAQTMDLDIRLNSTQNMPYSSISQINAAQRNSRSLPHTKIGGNGQAENNQQQFQHGQQEILRETGNDEVISGGQGQAVSSMHDILPPSTFPAINAQSVGQEDNFQQVQRQILPQHNSTEAVKHASQGQLNSQNLLPTMPAKTMDLNIRLNSSQNMPYSSTSQINDPHRDSWSLLHTHIGENGYAKNSQQQFQHGQSQILPEIRKDEVITGEEENFQQVQRQITPQHTSTEAVKHAGQGQLNSQNLLPGMPVRTMDLDISLNSSQSLSDSSTSRNNAPQGDSWLLPQTQIRGNGQGQLNSHQHHSLQQKSLFLTTHGEPMGKAENTLQQFQQCQPHIFPEASKDEVISGGQGQVVSSMHDILPPSTFPAINAQSVGQEENFQQVQRQILAQHTSIGAVKHDQRQLNSQNLLPAMPRETMDLATRLNASQNRPHCLDASASQVNPPQNSSQFPINNSSGPTEENYGSSLPMWQDSLQYTPEFYLDNQELFNMADSGL